MELADLVRFEQAGVGHQHYLHAETVGVGGEFQNVRMQGRLAAGEQQVARAGTVEDVDGLEAADPVDEFPFVLREGLARETAETAVGVAGIVQGELGEGRAALVAHQTQGVEAARNRARFRENGFSRPAL